MVFSSNIRTESSNKLELFKVPVLLAITGKPQTLASKVGFLSVLTCLSDLKREYLPDCF